MSEEEIEETIKKFCGEEFYQKFLEYLKDIEEVEKQLKKIPERQDNVKAIITLNQRFLELSLGFEFILALLLKSKLFNEDQRKNIESLRYDRKLFNLKI